MSIDPIFWDLVGLPQNRPAPLSFRHFGAWTCPAPDFAELNVPERDAVDLVARELLTMADEQLTGLSGWTLDKFLQLCREREASDDRYLPCIVTTLIAVGREPEALEVCAAAQESGRNGGFIAPEGSFVEMALRWLQQSAAQPTRQ
jgi:hypothetical protein